MDMHRPNSWVSHEFTTLKTLALVLKSNMSIARPEPKVDKGMHVSPSGVHHGKQPKRLWRVYISPNLESPS